MTADDRRKPAYYALLDALNDARLGVVRATPSAAPAATPSATASAAPTPAP